MGWNFFCNWVSIIWQDKLQFLFFHHFKVSKSMAKNHEKPFLGSSLGTCTCFKKYQTSKVKVKWKLLHNCMISPCFAGKSKHVSFWNKNWTICLPFSTVRCIFCCIYEEDVPILFYHFLNALDLSFAKETNKAEILVLTLWF